jgi:hypothetical protein
MRIAEVEAMVVTRLRYLRPGVLDVIDGITAIQS